ncbi:MAG: ATP-binding protein [Nitrospira sp.]|nr:GAF domain-containing protein [Nitrospira sp.]
MKRTECSAMANDVHTSHEAPSGPTTRFFGLRLKFVLLFSLILIVTCSTLSWYFVETRRQAMTSSLEELGTILLTNTVHNEHFRIAGVVLEDHITLGQFMSSLMTIDHVVYVVITGSDGRILDRQSKRVRTPSSHAVLASPPAIYPDDHLSESLLRTPLTTPVISRLVLSPDQRLIAQDETSDWLLSFFLRRETLFDFAMPVLREVSTAGSQSQRAVELEETAGLSPPTNTGAVVGIVRIGITDAQANQALLIIVRNVLFLTIMIIAAGILGAHFLTSRITTPLRILATATRKLSEGEETTSLLPPASNDEVGQLTHAFNVMIQSLRDHNQAIIRNLDTIRQQVRQLTTVHQASAAIAKTSMLDLDSLLETILRLLAQNLGFPRMTVLLYHPERNYTSIAKMIGVTPEAEAAARQLEIPITDGSITADLIIHGKPLLIHDIESVAHRFYPPTLELMRRSGTRSIVCVPLQNHAKILGYLVCSRGSLQCNEEDLDTLLTIAGHVAAAIDNAKTYADLAELTQHLEERIEQRTEELSHANTQLQEHDRRRSKFLSVVSHELRTPMTAIRSFAENMLDGVTGPLTELQRTYLTRVQHNVARLSRIIAQLLDWSRLDTKPIELRVENVCLHQIATIAADGLQMVASEKSVSLVVVPAESLPPVQGDRDKLEQIFVNLIGNAIKFTPPGGHISVESSVSSPGVVQICVADTGCGIDVTHLPNIFEEFSKVPSTMPASQGAQLGLWITKTFVTMHHGRIWVESQPGTGSRFYFTVPTAESQDVPKQSPHESMSSDYSPSTQSST